MSVDGAGSRPDDPAFALRVDPAVDGAVRVTITGSLDLATADLVFHTLAGVLARRRLARVDVDLGRLRLLDAAGIGVLLAARNRAETCGVAFAARGATGLPLRVLEITGVSGLLGGKP